LKILLLQPAMNWHRPYCETPSIALLTLAAIAGEYGHQVTVRHLDIDPLPEGSWDIIGITCNTFQVQGARELVNHYQDKARVVIGGPHAVAWTEADGKCEVVVGEGEDKWLKILGEQPRYHSDIDSIPLPDYSLVDMRRFTGVQPLGAIPSMVMFCARGCPGKCTFCNTPVFWGNRPRYRSPEAIVKQVEYFNTQFGAQEVFFQDDTFNANKPWAMEIFERIIARKLNSKMVFRIDCRTNERMMTTDFLKLAKQAGVWSIFLGIESGSQTMLDSMKKHTTVRENKRAIRLCHEAGIQVQAAFVIGLPGENWQTIKETRDFLSETQPEVMGFGFATPFPATELDRIVTAKGHKKTIDYADYRYGDLIVRTDELSYEDLAGIRLVPSRR
jgi:anaerobic magnesium-protoporphyrin IX monomethyl ester cyclase